MSTEDIYEDSWTAHTHEEITDPDGNVVPHVHAPESDWSVTFGIPMSFTHDDDLDVIELMEFRAMVMGMVARMEGQRTETDLRSRTVNEQQFAIIAYNADSILTQSLLAVIDQALLQQGVNPPCQLQPVDSSNIRSFGFVQVQEDGEEVPANGTLYVAFHGGTLYSYEGVLADTVQAFIEAESKGEFFGAYIRNAGYSFTKLAG